MKHGGLSRTAFLALLATAILLLVTGMRTPMAGESGLLRWARTAAAHPLRSLLALTLIGGAMRPGRRGEDE